MNKLRKSDFSLTVIPARGGSKGIIRKNLQTVNGKSLVERSVMSALKISNNRIVVSTDDFEIAQNVEKYPIEIFMRDKVNSTDTASSESVVLEVLNAYQFSSGLVTLLQATSPFVDIQSWGQALEYLKNQSEVHSMFSAVKKNLFTWQHNESWIPVNHDKKNRVLRQNKPPEVIETGCFYLFKAEKFLVEKTRFCGVTEPAFTKIWSNFDIDDAEDLNLCKDLSTVLDFPPYLQ